MRLRRKVHDGVDLLLLQHVHHQVRRLDVAFDESVGRKSRRHGVNWATQPHTQRPSRHMHAVRVQQPDARCSTQHLLT